MVLVNYIKKHYWSNGLIMVFILSSITPIITAYNIEVPLFSYNGSLFGATLYIVTACIMILYGYNTLKRNKSRRVCGVGDKMRVTLNKRYKYVMCGFALFGAVVAYKTLSAVSDVYTLQNMITEGEDVSELRYEMGSGGLGGIVKMFAAMPLCVFLINSGIYFFTEYEHNSLHNLKVVTIVSLVCVLFKVAIYFDRLSLLALILVFGYHFFYNRSLNKVVKIFVIGGLLFGAASITLLRMGDTSLLQFLGAYFNLGVINLQIVIDKQEHFNILPTETFLAPFSFVFKFFGLRFHSVSACDYVWNPAQSFYGFFYVDCQYWGLILLPLLGRSIKLIEINKFRKPFCCCFYFIAMYCLFSFCTIPIIRSVEFCLMIVTCILVTRFLINFKTS